MNREIKFRAWNDIDKAMIGWQTIKAFDSLLKKLLSDNVRHHFLMQYTGIKDKNGKEIYEGDIKDLCGDGKYLIVVAWNPETCGFCAKSSDGTLSEHLYGAHLSEVIGNIYENPELLKVKDNE